MAVTMNRIIDIHNHSLPFVDDGAKSLEEAIDNINYLKSLGITDIILTSHYILNSKYNATLSKREEIYQELKKSLDNDINIYLGNELFITDSKTILKLLQNKEITTLNNSRYLLIEFPINSKLNHIDQIICELNDNGIVPIIAHPERYPYFDRHLDELKNILEYNVLLQCNIESINGKYGKTAKKLLKKLLKENMVSFLATDFHHQSLSNLEKAFKKINKILSLEQLDILLNKNPLQVLNNGEIF